MDGYSQAYTKYRQKQKTANGKRETADEKGYHVVWIPILWLGGGRRWTAEKPPQGHPSSKRESLGRRSSAEEGKTKPL